LHRRGDRFVPVCNGDHLAAAIPDSRLVIVEGDDHLPYVGDATAVLREVEQFLVGTTHHTDGVRSAAGVVGDSLSSLTPAELRVADCVAKGMGNPAIAESLHLSRHTVESHLKRIYTKLGVTRIELAAIIISGANR
jgi:DNA-binding CsgD family transcriptional regulator